MTSAMLGLEVVVVELNLVGAGWLWWLLVVVVGVIVLDDLFFFDFFDFFFCCCNGARREASLRFLDFFPMFGGI